VSSFSLSVLALYSMKPYPPARSDVSETRIQFMKMVLQHVPQLLDVEHIDMKVMLLSVDVFYMIRPHHDQLEAQIFQDFDRNVLCRNHFAEYQVVFFAEASAQNLAIKAQVNSEKAPREGWTPGPFA